MSKKRPFSQTFKDQQENPSKKSKIFSDLKTNDREGVENFLQNINPTDTITTTSVEKYTNFSPMTHDYQKYMSQYLDPSDVNLSLVSKTSMLKPNIPEKWVVYSDLPFSLKDIIYWFQVKHLIVQQNTYSENSIQLLFKLGLLVNHCSAYSKGMEISNPNKEDIKNYHEKVFQLNPSQIETLKTICAKNLSSIRSSQDFYLFQFLNFKLNVKNYTALFYEPFQGPNPYPYHFQIHWNTPVFNHFFSQIPPSKTPEEIQQENIKKKYIFAHPAFTSVYDCNIDDDPYFGLKKTLLGIKYGYYHPQRIMIDHLNLIPMSYVENINLSDSISDISEFVSLTGKPINRLIYDYFNGKYLMSSQDILNFYSTVLKENWFHEYTIAINNIMNKPLLSQLLSLFNIHGVIPHLGVKRSEWVPYYDLLTQTPFIQIVNDPNDIINISKNLKGIKFQPFESLTDDIKSVFHKKLKQFYPNTQWTFQTDPWNQNWFLATPKTELIEIPFKPYWLV